MNCPSRNDDTLQHPDWNQSPPPFSPDTTTRNDLNGIANSRVHRRHANSVNPDDPLTIDRPYSQQDRDRHKGNVTSGEVIAADSEGNSPPSSESPRRPFFSCLTSSSRHCARSLAKFSRFIGPGFLIAVAYIDPGNYSTDVAAGADFKYALLFIVLISNLFAILLQSLCVKLGSVTGLNLAENCREHLPKWLVWFLYVLAESAIVATDIAEVCLGVCVVSDGCTDNCEGGWISDRIELTSEDPLGSRLCYHIGGCSVHSYVLSTQWSDVGTSIIRILRDGSGLGRGHLLLHPTLYDSRPVRWRSLPWIFTIFSHHSIRWVNYSDPVVKNHSCNAKFTNAVADFTKAVGSSVPL